MLLIYFVVVFGSWRINDDDDDDDMFAPSRDVHVIADHFQTTSPPRIESPVEAVDFSSIIMLDVL